MPADASLDELEFLAAFANRVQTRLERPRELVVERPSPARFEPVLAWFERHLGESVRRVAQLERDTNPRDFDEPHAVRAGLKRAQKPFQLWNVKRQEWRDPIAWERGLTYTIGEAAKEYGPTHDGHPGTVTPTSVLAKSAWGEWTNTHRSAWATRRNIVFSLLAQETGFGKKDPKRAQGER